MKEYRPLIYILVTLVTLVTEIVFEREPRVTKWLQKAVTGGREMVTVVTGNFSVTFLWLMITSGKKVVTFW